MNRASQFNGAGISPRLNKKSKTFNWAGGVNKGQKESETRDWIILEGKKAEPVDDSAFDTR
jgi:hypothetical protein